MSRAVDPTRPLKTIVFDLETSGLLQRYQQDLQEGVGISEFAVRVRGQPGGYRRFTNLLRDPLERYDAGEITAQAFGNVLEKTGPTGARWQKGFRSQGNTLQSVLERHINATRSAISGRGDALVQESKLVSLMTRYLRQGHKVQGWNVDFDMQVMSGVAARSNPAVRERWSKALNAARSRGQIEDLSHNAKKFMFLAAQESMMRGQGHEFFTLGQVNKDLVMQAKSGKLNVHDIDNLSYDTLMEPHQGFKEFFERRLGRRGRPDISFERQAAWLRKKQSRLTRADMFATGQKYPNVRMTKGWSADILMSTLAPGGIKGSTLEAKAIALSQSRGMQAHEALSDTVYEEIFDDLFRVKSKTWAGAWGEMAPRLKEYDIGSQEELFHRYRSAIEIKSKSQLKEHALEATRTVDNSWERILGSRSQAGKVSAKDIAGAAAQQPETLRKIYSEAYSEVSGKWRTLRTAHPAVAVGAQILAAAAIADYLLPDRQRPTKGVRDPDDAPYLNINGMHFGPASGGVARGLTDFGSGRHPFNPQTTGFAELAAYRASIAVRYPPMYGIDQDTLEKNYDLWTSARASARTSLFTRGQYDIQKGGSTGVRGLNRDAWVGIIDLKHYRVKADDADTLTLQRKGVVGMFRKPVSVRLAGIDAPEIQHGGTASVEDSYAYGRVAEEQFGGRESGDYLQKLIERQQSLRLVVDPSSTTYNRHVGVLIGDRRKNLNLQLVRAGAASALPWSGKRSLVDDNVFAEAEAKAAASGVGIWESKGWQAHRAMGLIAGTRVTKTTLAQVARITKSNALMAWYGVVQNAHDDKTRWTPQEMERMYQIGGAYRAEITGAINAREASIGPLPAIRKPVNPWQIAGHGINPSDMPGANISDFGSGRKLQNLEQLKRLPKGDSALAMALRSKGISMGEFQGLMVKNPWARDISNIFRVTDRLTSNSATRFFKYESLLKSTLESKVGLTLNALERFAGGIGSGEFGIDILDPIKSVLDPKDASYVTDLRRLAAYSKRLYNRGVQDTTISDLVGHGRSRSAQEMADWIMEAKDGNWGWTARAKMLSEGRRAKVKAAAPKPAISPQVQRRIWAGDIQREELRAKQLLIQRAEHRPPRIVHLHPLEGEPAATPGVRKEVRPAVDKASVRITAKNPEPIPVPAAVKQATKDLLPARVEVPVPRATSGRSAKILAMGKTDHSLGIGIAAAAGLAIGTWMLLRSRNEADAGRMANTTAVGPNEFVAMKSHPPFYSSSKAAQWAEHQAAGDPAATGSKFKDKLGQFGGLAVQSMHFSIYDSPALKAWDYFYHAQGVHLFTKTFGSKGTLSATKGLVVKAHARIYYGLKRQGFTDAEINVWMKQMTPFTDRALGRGRGFTAKISKDLNSKNWVEKITEKWEAINKWPAKAIDIFNAKKSKLVSGMGQRIQDWFSSLSTTSQAKAHGMSVNQYVDIAKAGKAGNLAKTSLVYNWARQKDNFKYVWKHLYKDATSFGSKVDGARQIFANLGQLEHMRMSLQENLLGLAPGSISRSKNAFTSVGQRLKVYMHRSKFFSGKWPAASAKIISMGNKLKAFGATSAGRVLGKVPYANLALGLLEGVQGMDQYESAAKGFLVETAAGTAGTVVEFAIANPTTIMAAGKIGFGVGLKAGTAVGAAVGALFAGVGAGPGALVGGAIGSVLGAAVGVVGVLATSALAGYITRSGVQAAGRTALGARMKRTIDPAAYLGPDDLYQTGGFPSIRNGSIGNFQQLHAIDSPRTDLTPFGGSYNPIQGQDIDTRTLQIINNKRQVTAKPMAPRPISTFTPTAGLVNIVLWNNRKGSKIRSVTERSAHQHRLPRRDRNSSRMLAHAA